uniref:acetyl-CoA carboxylase carboxyltransferase beta subunit n=1 Tax=Guaduella macrostachys TaxID=2885236 RepID=UPI001F1438D2|nr:acetyl-CoA carboxylase carboxyltransferase beta subunit [Guaduella macrostachys]YP_010293491.1 acetyl-CoA carboxylase carboxyltransferase beta subunit [Guaduella oblonga]ULQ66154.1 acetyl-CoA carboxylase carboxyltransferase beta subunit [Guaduella macrostachys]ULQ66206.1 acetyl-CoA carboxylase carboxyltransferase beta subunit [Guaduella oblonga]
MRFWRNTYAGRKLQLNKKPKIASTLRHYQSTKKPYVSILTTGGIRACFGMLGDILISKPDAHLAFVGVREWLKKYCMWKEVDETDFGFEMGAFD